MASFAAAFPILPGKTEQWKRFCQETVGPRRSEYEAANNRLGVTRDFAALQQTPQGEWGYKSHKQGFTLLTRRRMRNATASHF